VAALSAPASVYETWRLVHRNRRHLFRVGRACHRHRCPVGQRKV